MNNSRPPPGLLTQAHAVVRISDDCALPAHSEQRLPSPTAQSPSPWAKKQTALDVAPRHVGARRMLAYETIADAAPRLGMTVQALRARCRRGAVREGREVRCYLGDGVVATKFGRSWRVKFPP